MPGRRGRHRCQRWVTDVPDVQYFKPAGVPPNSLQVVELTIDEVEILRLVDIDGLTQEDAAVKMGISRRTLWSDLMNVRKKVAFALVNGQAIHIRGGAYAVAGADEERRKNIYAKEGRKRTKE